MTGTMLRIAVSVALAAGCSNGLLVGRFDVGDAAVTSPADGADAPPAETAPPAQLTIDMAKAMFGSVSLGGTSGPKDFRITNSGGTTTTVLGVTVSPPFVVRVDDCNGNTLVPGGFCAVSLAMIPQAAGPLEGTLIVGENNGSSVSATLTGTGSSLSITPSAVDLGCVPGSRAATTFTVRNDGPLIGSLSVSVNDARFMFNATAPQCAGTLLFPNATCNQVVTFAPAAADCACGAILRAVLTVRLVGDAGVDETSAELSVATRACM